MSKIADDIRQESGTLGFYSLIPILSQIGVSSVSNHPADTCAAFADYSVNLINSIPRHHTDF